jgi:hypothetical protein
LYDYSYAPIDGNELYLERVGLAAHLKIIDDILADCSSQRRRELLLNNALLGAAMELHLIPSDTVEGRRAVLIECDECLWTIYAPEDLLRLYEGDRLLERLHELAQRALLARLPAIA